MISLFLGLCASNFLLMGTVFILGLIATRSADQSEHLRVLHVSLGVAWGLMATLSHIAVYTYFMATAKWVRAATDKSGIDPGRLALPAEKNKKRSLPAALAPVAVVMLTMFSGAAVDAVVGAALSGWVHLVLSILAVVVNVACSFGEYRLIVSQRRLMDRALGILNCSPGSSFDGSVGRKLS